MICYLQNKKVTEKCIEILFLLECIANNFFLTKVIHFDGIFMKYFVFNKIQVKLMKVCNRIRMKKEKD